MLLCNTADSRGWCYRKLEKRGKGLVSAGHSGVGNGVNLLGLGFWLFESWESQNDSGMAVTAAPNCIGLDFEEQISCGCSESLGEDKLIGSLKRRRAIYCSDADGHFSLAISIVFSHGVDGLCALHQLVEPNVDERERATGFMTGVTAAASVSEASRRQVLGQAMDLNCLTWIVSLGLAEQRRYRMVSMR
ncbi:hypothetical protein AXG93_1278s1000 [Marchantia polymorpha subsp. ruderalis]|uniref:Uncharacterized protein n=1 Tax=Marchantia polymorpha subsp. ruderalis TaxID=1480154 RepID=A0A176WS25_MARPO|nr:hypothetical protein AXG93_1278s1000 [Marchantia polymorpha subsp. ruderalis]